MTRRHRPRALLIGVSKAATRPWWWQQVDHDALGCQLEYQTILLKDGRPSRPFTIQFVSMCVQLAIILLRARRAGVRYVFSFECDTVGFAISALQTLLFFRTPRHVIVQFIMREKTHGFRSKLKYAFMRWCFRSVYLCVCSSRTEADYYAAAFGWPASKLAYVPFHTDPAFVERDRVREEPFVLSAGRTFRDYQTLLAAFAPLEVPLVVVAGRASHNWEDVPPHVTVNYELPLQALIGLIARSMIVVLPLEDKQISIGQSVLLEAMAMGKAVIVTRVNGTIDYIDHMKTGILVPPRDPGAIRDAVRLLIEDPALRLRLGEAARAQVLREHLPNHYAQGVSSTLSRMR